MSPPCVRCGWLHSPNMAAIAVGLFSKTPTRYRSVLGGPLRDTRAEAELDYCDAKVESGGAA